MRLIFTYIAFIVILLFIFVVVSLVGISAWLHSYYASSDKEKYVARVELKSNEVIFYYSDSQSAFESLLSRDLTSNGPSLHKSKGFAKYSNSLEIQFLRVTFTDKLNFLGYSTIYKPYSIKYGFGNSKLFNGYDFVFDFLQLNRNKLKSVVQLVTVDTVELSGEDVSKDLFINGGEIYLKK